MKSKKQKVRLSFGSIFKLKYTTLWWQIAAFIFGLIGIIFIAVTPFMMVLYFLAPDAAKTFATALLDFGSFLGDLSLELFSVVMLISIPFMYEAIKEFIDRRGYIKTGYPEFAVACKKVSESTGFHIDSRDSEHFFVWVSRNRDRKFYFSKIKNNRLAEINQLTGEYYTIEEMINKIAQVYGNIDRYDYSHDFVRINMYTPLQPDHLALMFTIYSYIMENEVYFKRHEVYYDKDKNRIYYEEDLGFFYM